MCDRLSTGVGLFSISVYGGDKDLGDSKGESLLMMEVVYVGESLSLRLFPVEANVDNQSGG